MCPPVCDVLTKEKELMHLVLGNSILCTLLRVLFYMCFDGNGMQSKSDQPKLIFQMKRKILYSQTCRLGEYGQHENSNHFYDIFSSPSFTFESILFNILSLTNMVFIREWRRDSRAYITIKYAYSLFSLFVD